MLETVILLLVLFWLLGLVSIGGNAIHTLLVLALVLFIVRLAQGRV